VNILLESRAFHPSIGGLEMMAQELGRAWERQDHDVRVITVTPLKENPELSDLDVIRSPSSREWLHQMKWADVFFQNGVSLKSLWYALLAGCPIVFRHPDVLRSNTGGFDFRNELKRWATTLGHNVVSSKAVAKPIRGATTHVPNTFRPAFQDAASKVSARERSGLLFVGRLVSVKGADVAIEALRRLHDRGVEKSLTICGGGPDRSVLESQVHRAGLTDFVSFEGWADPEALIQYYSEAEVTLVPSRYEPFGIVALEAIACGCPVVASSVHGLPEAVGDCGLLVEPDQPNALAETIEQALQDDVQARLKAAMSDHVDRHRIGRIAGKYLEVIQEAIHEA
jgi:glycosyltransferase involved in cell wall biosynthesis